MARPMLLMVAMMLSAVPVWAASGGLPLKSGLYVDASISCELASNADLLRYDASGFGFPASITDTEVLARKGQTFSVRLTFYAIEDGALQNKVRWRVAVAGNERFAVLNDDGSREYRLCEE